MSGHRESAAPPHEAPAASQAREWGGGRLMILEQPDEPKRARVIGSLTGESVGILLDAVNGGISVLDLSQVDHVDQNGLRELGRLWEEHCTLVGRPRWLELWLQQARRTRR